MAGKQNDAQLLAQMVSQFVRRETDKTQNRMFKRGVIDSVVGQKADVFIDGATVTTQSVLCIDSYTPQVGDKVLIISIGSSGANLIIIGSING